MPRVKCFDREEALQNAMQAFWLKGFEATSVQDLVDCMGINRGSLYDTFGDKRNLFLEVLDHYSQTSLKLAEGMRADGNAREQISAFLHGFMQRNLDDQQNRGCLVTNTAIERSHYDEECAVRVRRHMGTLEAAFEAAIRRGQHAGDIVSTQDAAVLAAFLIGVLQGIRVIAKVNPDENKLRPMVDMALASLDN
ncbi:TetR/AcrR family transcriptional regulator [Sneathiella chinensis]|uniref:TetR family transcriptional regulator n=1 Tax=Sneathiella chinensis TaxID=349750 RepID=A0ABQ5U0V4_9PROT|nr:TetR/AcrR family transcriptional regulator [Sneathiella chinensis]GLQ05281.1 TetR family transcriptional regulator [Sneathiella chinensis]